VRPGRIARVCGVVVLAVAVGLLATTLVAGLGRIAWIAGAVLVPVGGLLLATAAWSAAEARGDGNAALLTRSAAPLVVTIAACVVLLALPGWLLDRSNDELIAWTAPDVVLVDGDVALSADPREGQPAEPAPTGGDALRDPVPERDLVGRDPDDGEVRWRTPLRRSDRHPFDADDPDGWHRVGDVALVSGDGFGMAAVDVRTGRLLWQDVDRAPRVVLATTRTVASTDCGEAGPCVAEGRDLRTGRVRWSAPTRDEGRSLGAPSTTPARDDGPWPSRWAVVEAPASDAPGGRRSWTVRDVDTGRVVSRGTAEVGTTLTTFAGGVLRGDPSGDTGEATRLRLQDPATGRTRWSRTVEGRPVDAGASQSSSVAAPGGWIALQPRQGEADAGLEPSIRDEPSLPLVDPRDGRPVAVRVADETRRVVLVRSPMPPVTAATVASGAAPASRLVGLDPDAGLGLVLAPGRGGAPPTWPEDETSNRRLTLAGDLIARRRLAAYADAVGETQDDGIELRDVATTRVVGRLRGEGLSPPEAEGDRIVVRREGGRGEDDEDLVLVRRP